MIHELKIWPQYFEDVESGRKNFEVRKLDRLFGVGDTLHLKEWSPTGGYSGRETKKIVTYVMPGGQWGLSEGNCIMGIYPTPEGVTAEAVMDRHYNQNLGFLSVTWDQVISAMHEYASLVSSPKDKEIAELKEGRDAAREDEAIQFHDWVTKRGWEIDFGAQYSHTTAELYRLYANYKKQ